MSAACQYVDKLDKEGVMGKVRRFKFLREGLKSAFDGYQWEIGEWQKTECVELCHGFNCSRRIIDAMGYVSGEILAEVEVRGKHFNGDDKSTHAEMKIVRAWKWQKEDSVALSIFSAELVLKNFESKFPTDDRPRKAIKAAKNYLAKQTAENQSAAWSARSAARSAAWSAWSARSAESAESAARSAAWSAWSAARSAESAESAESAARSAWSAENTIETWLLQHLESMEEIK
jgi:hypothetical protein